MATTRGTKPSQIAPDVMVLQDFARGTDRSRTIPVAGSAFQTQVPDVVRYPIASFLASSKVRADKARGYTILPDGSIGDIHDE